MLFSVVTSKLCNFYDFMKTKLKLDWSEEREKKKTYFVDMFPVGFLWKSANLIAQKYIQ